MAVPIPDGVALPALVVLLADGEVHSGVELSRALRAGRGSLTRAIEQLRRLGVNVEAVARRGYKFSRPVELLEPSRIRAGLREECRERLRGLEVLFSVDSTNTRMLAEPAPPVGLADACFSELQLGGRGRRGRSWVSPFGGSIALSVGWAFSAAARANSALSLAVGVAVERALSRAGAEGIRLKWPNDIWFNDRKIGGILVELRTEGAGGAHMVVGVGLNLEVSPEARREIETGGARIAALRDAAPQGISRNRLAATLLEELLSMLASFERDGFSPHRAAFAALDALAGRKVCVLAGESAIEGISRGVDLDGALLLDGGGPLQRFVSGEVSLRLAGEA